MRPTSPRALAPALVLTFALAGGAAHAQAASPRMLQGFTHPDITQCQTVTANRRECTVPANVGGHYLIEAAGFASSTAPDAALAMNIIVGEQVCITQAGAKFTGRGYIHLICETTLATDAPIKIAVNIGARDATPDKEGPKLVVRGMPWDGVLSVRGADGGALPSGPATPPAASPPAKPGH